MQFKKSLEKKSIMLILWAVLLNYSPVLANTFLNEIDSLRAELSCLKDKNSPEYNKTKQKLEKIIAKNKIDYSDDMRFSDIQRLIAQQKYNCAIYELESLIEKNYKLSECYELLGDIFYNSQDSAKKIAKQYKLSLTYDNQNINASYKLAKLYLREKKNIIAIEYLKQTVENTNDEKNLNEIAELISQNIEPQSKYEANNLYETLGNIYYKLGQKNDAFEAYSKALMVNQKDIFLRYHLANLLYENEQNKHALGLFDTILFENPKDNQIKVSKAKTLFKQGDLLSASKVYEEILEQYPDSNQAKYGIYKIYENKLSPVDILKKINKKQNYTPSTDELIAFADMLDNMNETDAAQKFIKCAKTLEEEKNKTIAQNTISKPEKIQKTTQENKAKEKNTENKQKIQNKKSTQTKKEPQPKKQDKQEKKENTEKIKKLEQEKKELEAKKLEEQLKKQNALISAERKKAMEKNPKKYAKLKAEADKFLAMEPKTSQNFIAAANTYKQMGEPTSALKYYEEAKKLDPTNSDIYYNIGLTHFELNNTQNAKTNLTKSLNLDKDNTKAKNLLAFVNQKIITQIINQAYALYEKKDYIPAFESLDKGIKEYPQNAQLHYYRALIYIAMNRNAAAIIDLQKSIELDESQYMAYYQLGQTYEKINDERSALVAYEKFLSIEPDEKELISDVQQKVLELGKKYY